MTTFIYDLQLFADLTTDIPAPLNKTTDSGLAVTMKQFYDTQLLKNARAQLYFNQFGMKQQLPKNAGRSIEFRRFNKYNPVTTPLTEGVTPSGQTISMTKLEAEIQQYGAYTAITDRLELEAVDPIVMGVTEESGAAAGESMDILTRDVLMTGTNVIYGGGKTSRNALGASDTLTPVLVDQARTALKKQLAPTINGKYICITHPSVIYDLREHQDWKDAHVYASPEQIYNGEVGELHGVRFIETTMSKIWKGTDPANNTAANTAVYSALFFGKDAYGIIEPTAESMEVIVKQRGSAGTADPLDQRSTVGWKASTAALILYQERMVRCEVGSFYSSKDTAN